MAHDVTDLPDLDLRTPAEMVDAYTLALAVLYVRRYLTGNDGATETFMVDTTKTTRELTLALLSLTSDALLRAHGIDRSDRPDAGPVSTR